MPPASKAKRKAKKASPSLAQRRRAKSTKCKGTTRDGMPCTKPAGWGTDHLGTGNCKHHNGSTRNGSAAAARDEAHGMSKALRVSPGQAILGVLHLAAGQLAYATAKVAALDEDETFETLEGPEGGVVAVLPNRWIRLQSSLEKDVAKFSRAAADMGIQERQQSLREHQTAMFHNVLEAVLGELKLTPAQRKAVGPAIRKQIPAFIEGTAEEVPA